MASDYVKLTPTKFEELLAEHRYVSLMTAKRAIARMTTWTAKEKKAAQAAAERHFSQMVVPPEAIAAAERRNMTRKRKGQKVVVAKTQPIDGQALLTFAKDIQSLKNSKLKLSFIRVIRTAKQANIELEEVMAAIA